MKPKRNLTKLIKIKISLICLIAGTILTGCSGTSVFVLNQDEIVMLSEGETLVAPYNGTFYSERAEKRVMNAKKVKADLQ